MSFHIVSIDSPQCSLSCKDGQLTCKPPEGEKKLPNRRRGFHDHYQLLGEHSLTSFSGSGKAWCGAHHLRRFQAGQSGSASESFDRHIGESRVAQARPENPRQAMAANTPKSFCKTDHPGKDQRLTNIDCGISRRIERAKTCQKSFA